VRHNLWKVKYPDTAEVHGIPWQGLSNRLVTLDEMFEKSTLKLEENFEI